MFNKGLGAEKGTNLGEQPVSLNKPDMPGMDMVQMLGLGGLGSCNEDQMLELIKAIAMRGVHKEVHRATFQSMHQQ